MERSEHPRVVVIGAGIVGSAIAMHLAERDLRPVLVDQGRAGQTASARSFASLSAFGADPLGYYQLACAALARWSKWAQRLGEVGLRRGGQLRWVADPQEARRLAEQVEQARSLGYPIMPVDQTGLRRLLPAAEPGPVAAGCHAPQDGQVEPDLVVAACRSATTAAGGRLLLGEPAQVRLDDHGIRVEIGVLAAGAESVAIVRTVGLDIPTLASPGLLVETERLPAFTDKVVYLPGGPGPQVHLRQRPDGSVLLGERSQEQVARALSQQHARALLGQAARFLPVLRRLVADEFATGEPQWLLAPFRASRFAERATRVVLDIEDLFR